MEPSSSSHITISKRTLYLGIIGIVFILFIIASSYFNSQKSIAPSGSGDSNITDKLNEYINNFTVTQDISTQIIPEMDIEERSTDILVTYPDGKTYRIDSDYIEPVIDVSKVDINFDGVQDVRIDLSMGAYNMGADFYIQNPKTQTFTRYNLTGRNPDEEGDIFPGLGFVTIDEETRMLKSFFKGRGLGDIYAVETYKFVTETGNWVIVEREVQDTYFVPGASEGDGWGPYYINKVVDYTKQPPATTTKYLKLEEKDGEYNFVPVAKPVSNRYAQ